MKLAIDQSQLEEWGLSQELAEKAAQEINQILSRCNGEEAWARLKQEILSPNTPFQVHQGLFDMLSSAWSENRPFPAWTPDRKMLEEAGAAQLRREKGFAHFPDLYKWSVDHKEVFWETIVDKLGVVFHKKPDKLLDSSAGDASPQWFPGAEMNIIESCFQGDPQQQAMIYRPTPGAPLERMTYDQLNKASNRVANSLMNSGFKKGDALAIDMTMTAESVIIYLGIVKAGCCVISIADSFSPEEIATRLRIGEAKGIFTMDAIPRGGKLLPMYTKVIEAKAPRAIVIPCGKNTGTTLREGDMTWSSFLVENEVFETVKCNPHDTINILFSSGTTGDPKAIPWNHATPLKGAMDGYLHHDIRKGDVVAWPTNLGWMMGPWLIFASLLNKGAIALYGEAPNTREFCEFVQDAEVNMLGVVPSLVKAWKQTGAVDGLDWSSIRAFSSTGECSSPADMLYLMSRVKGYRPVIEYCGGTEIGGGYVMSTVIQPSAPSTFSTPSLGLELYLVDPEGNQSNEGELYLIGPSIGLSVKLLNKDHYQEYFADTPQGPEGKTLRRHGDQLECLPGGYYRALGRADDTMNLGGIKTSSAEIERTLKLVEGIDETAAIASSPQGGGPSQLVIYAVTLQDLDPNDLKKRLQSAIRSHLNPLFKIHDVCITSKLPRTASGKVMRRILRDQYARLHN